MDEASANRIDHDCKDDRHCMGCVDQRRYSRVADCQDDLGDCNQFRCIFPATSGIPCAATNVDLYIAALNLTQSLKLFGKRTDTIFGLWIGHGDACEHADPAQLLLLRMRPKRPGGRRTGNGFDEISPFHSAPDDTGMVSA